MPVTEADCVECRAHMERALAQRDRQAERAQAQLCELLTIKIDALDRLSESERKEIRVSIQLASQVLTERLELSNEVRAQLGAQATTFVTLHKMESEIRPLEVQVADLTKSRDEAKGKASQASVFVAGFFALAGFVMGLIQLLT